MQNIFYKQIIENSNLGYAYHKILCDENGKPCDYEYIEINQAFADITGFKRENIIGKTITKVLPDIINSEFDWIACFGDIALNKTEKKFEQYSEALKKWYKVHAFSPEKEYFVALASDITDEKIQIQDISKLFEQSDEFLDKTKELDYQKVTDVVLEISGAKFAVFNLYDEDGKTFNTMALSGEQSIIKKAFSFLNIKFENMQWIHDPIRAEKIKDKITTSFSILHELTGDIIPKSAINLLIERFNIGETLVVKISKNNIMLGDFTIIMKKNTTFYKYDIVELFANQVGLVIERIRAEKKAMANANLFYSLFSSMSSGVAIYKVINEGAEGKDYIVMDFNKSALAMENKTIDEVRGKSLFDLRPNIDEYGIIDIFQEVWKTGEPKHFPTKIYVDKNYSNWYENRIFKLPTGEIAAIYDDVSEVKRMEEKLHNEKEKYKTTLLSVGDGIISTDENGNVTVINYVAENLTGWNYEEAAGKPLEEVFYIVNEFTHERCENPVQKVLETGNIIELANHTMLISKDGIERPIEDSAAPIRDGNGNITGVVLVFRDFTDKKKSQDEIEHLSFHDHLTGLYNRRFFEEEIKRLDTEKNLPISIIMGDVNGLKLINDSFGHFAGDELLGKVANVISRSSRKKDIIARIGGDEIAILLPRTDSSEAKKIIEKMKVNLKKEKIRNMEISVSFGHQTKTDFTESILYILRKAEDLMYSNKLFEGPSVRGIVIKNIVETINKKSPREKAHSERVSEICFAMSHALDLDDRDANQMKMFGLLHDIGKIAIDDNILNKTEVLTELEYKEMSRHAEIGYRILSTANDMSEIADHVLLHHERWDGNGYPKGIRGKDIPLASRICAIADAYDAITSERTYRAAMSEEYAISELKKNAGTQFDPEIVEVFLEKVLPYRGQF